MTRLHEALAATSPAVVRRLPQMLREPTLLRMHHRLQDRDRTLEFKTRHGVRLKGRSSDTLIANSYIYGAWERDITDAMVPRLLPSSVMIDIGANVGYYSALAAKRGVGKVFAVEAVPRTVDLLRETLAINDPAGTVEVLPVAASDTNGTVTIYPSSNPLLASSLPQDGEPVEVESARLADLIPHDLWSRINVVKVDVEGYEVQALRGLLPALQVMPEDSAIFVEVDRQRLAAAGTSADELDELLQNAGFTSRYDLYNPYRWELMAEMHRRDPIPSPGAMPLHSVDMMYVRRRREGEVAPGWYVPKPLG